MLDRKYIVEHPDLVKQNCAARGVTAAVDQLIALEAERRVKSNEAQELNRLANETSKLIGKAASAEAREELKEKGRSLREQKDAA